MSFLRNRPHEAPFVGPAWWVAALWLAGALLVQTTVLHFFAIHNVTPSFVLVVVVWYSIRVDSRRAAIFGLIAGVLYDALTLQSGAAWTISTTLVAIVAGMLSRGFFADSIPLVSAITFVATLVWRLIFWIVMAFEGYPSGLSAMHFREALAQGIANAVVMLVAMMIVRRFASDEG